MPKLGNYFTIFKAAERPPAKKWSEETSLMTEKISSEVVYSSGFVVRKRWGSRNEKIAEMTQLMLKSLLGSCSGAADNDRGHETQNKSHASIRAILTNRTDEIMAQSYPA